MTKNTAKMITPKKLTLGIAALAAFAFVGLDTKTAEAAHGFGGFGGFGIHLGGRNVHLDIGNPHGYGYRNQVVSRSYYPRYQTRSYYDWHDTSHYDYDPGGYVRHGNHLDYQRGHFDYHQQGHYDRHSGGHNGGHH